VFYALVFLTRYTDLFQEINGWNFFFKIFYFLSSFYTIGIMRLVYPRTREREAAWKMSAVIAGGCLVLSPFVMLIFIEKELWGFREVRERSSILVTRVVPLLTDMCVHSGSGYSPKSSNPSASSRSCCYCARPPYQRSSRPSTSSSWGLTERCT